MMRSGVKMTTMLFVLILLLMAAFCSAKNNKQSDTKVTAFILMVTTHFLIQLMLIHGETRNNVSCVNFTKSVCRLIKKCSRCIQKLRWYDYLRNLSKIDRYRERTFSRLKQSKVTSLPTW